MLYQIKHVTRFFYDRPVFCEPLKLRLRPRDDPWQRVTWHRLDIDPAPAGRADSLDLEGARFSLAWFDETTQRLCVTANSVVCVERENPFDFLLTPQGMSLPIRPTAAEEALCQWYGSDVEPSAAVGALARELCVQADGRSLPFAIEAARWIAAELPCRPRPNEPPRSAAETMSAGSGACRDLAVVFNSLCRTVGLPARFVSGYVYSEQADASELHAWSEVYLPGAGWRGFDPSLGMAVAGRHVAVTAAKDPAAAAPTEGSFRGTNTRSWLETQLVMRILSETSTGNDSSFHGPFGQQQLAAAP